MFARSIAATVASLGVWMLAAAVSLGASLPSDDLLRNGDADEGPGALATEWVNPVGWSSDRVLMSAVSYTAPGSPAPLGQLSPPNYFAGGPGQANAFLEVTVDVSAWARQIDSLGASVLMTGHLGGFGNHDDRTTVGINALPRRFTIVTVEGPDAAARRNVTTFVDHDGTAVVPPGTRRLEFIVWAQRFDGDYNDGYADQLVLVLIPNRATAQPKAAVERDCDRNELFDSFLSSQQFSSVRFSLGRRSFVDRSKPYYAVFRNVADGSRTATTIVATKRDGTQLRQVRAMPACEPTIPA